MESSVRKKLTEALLKDLSSKENRKLRKTLQSAQPHMLILDDLNFINETVSKLIERGRISKDVKVVTLGKAELATARSIAKGYQDGYIKRHKKDINRHKKDLTPKLKEYEIKYPQDKGYQSFIMNHIGKDKDGAITIPYWENGKVIGIKHHKPKNDKQSWWEGEGSIKWYNSWNFDAYHKDQLIICEGEKDANRLVQLGYNATSTSGGALSVPTIPDKFKEPNKRKISFLHLIIVASIQYLG